MIFAYGNSKADWLAASVWIWMEFGLFHYFKAKMPKRWESGMKPKAVFFLWWAVLTWVQMEQASMPFFYNYSLRIILLILYSKIVNEASLLLRSYVTLIFFLVKDICKVVLIDIVSPVFQISTSENPWISWGFMLICVLLQFLILSLVRPSIRMEGGLSLKKSDVAAMFFPAIPYALVKYLQIRSYTNGNSQEIETSIVCLMLCICDLIILVQTEYRITNQIVQEEEKYLRLRFQAQQEWYSQEQEKIGQINAIYHDMKHHFTYISSLNDNQKIQEYISSISREMRHCEIFATTGNEVIDSVLAKAGGECSRFEINLIPSIRGKIFEFIDPKDLLVIFGNALDNAIEAEKQVSLEEGREIIVRGDIRQNFAILRVENHFSGELVFEQDRTIKTTKKDRENHGYGIKNIRSAAKRWGGEVAIDAKDGRFLLTVTIPILHLRESERQSSRIS